MTNMLLFLVTAFACGTKLFEQTPGHGNPQVGQWVDLKRGSRSKYLVLIFDYSNCIATLIATPERWRLDTLHRMVKCLPVHCE